jgi:serine/threonine protein kinase/tetratricopeptide (TPR) repeat protein
MPLKCPHCTSDNPESAQFCAECGYRLQTNLEKEEPYTKTLVAPRDELTTGSTFAERFQIIEEIGKGGMGRVYKAFDTEVQEKIALKLIKPEIAADHDTIARFRNELKLARRIAHRNVTQMFELGKYAGAYYITMEYVPGEDLKSFIRRIGQLPVNKALAIAVQIAGGMAEAHRLGVIHRDLKPRNVIIDKEGNARIMDFGIARSIASKGLTEKGIMVGTPEYVSPEQAETKDVDGRSDIYSFGVVLFEMLTGCVPFEGETPLAVAVKHRTEKPPRPESLNPQIPAELSSLILKCLEKDRVHRFSSAEALLKTLQAIQSELPTAETVAAKKRPTSAKEITVTVDLKRPLLYVIIFLILTVSLVVIWRTRSRPDLTPAPSDKPSLAVMYFKNNTGETGMDHWRTALSDLLITDLHQSKYLRVLSGEQLFQILDDLDATDSAAYSTEILREVGNKGRVERVLIGNYTEAGGTYRINVSLQDAGSGELLASQSVEGQGERSFYAMVDSLTTWVKSHFPLTDRERADDIDHKVEKITTSSPEALKIYSEARRLHLQARYAESIFRMQDALKIDPDFAMAYRSVAVSWSNQGYKPARNKNIEKAFELSDRVSERERLIIRGDYYMSAERTYDKAIEAYGNLLALYPDDRIGNTNLGIVHFELEEYDKAVPLYEHNIRNQPAGMLAYWNLAETYMAMGEYGRARRILERYLEHDPDNDDVSWKIGEICLFSGEVDRAGTMLDDMLTSDSGNQYRASLAAAYIAVIKDELSLAEKKFRELPEGAPDRRNGLANIYLIQGKFRAARQVLQKPTRLYHTLADVFLKSGRPAEALEEYEKELRDAVRNQSLRWHAHVLHSKALAYLDLEDELEARRMADEIVVLVESGLNKNLMRYHHHLMGLIELRGGAVRRAVSLLEKAVANLYFPESNFPPVHPLFYATLAEAYFKSGELTKAENFCRKIIRLNLGRIQDGDIYAHCFYQLGKILEDRGEPQEAARYYRRFLEFWEASDSGRPEIQDARERLEFLQK